VTFLLQIDAPDGGWVAPEGLDHLGRASLSRGRNRTPPADRGQGVGGSVSLILVINGSGEGLGRSNRRSSHALWLETYRADRGSRKLAY
jgi:hypothetical protein